MDVTRRDFFKKAGIGAATMTVGGVVPGFSAVSYNRIIGANERINVGMIGVNSRGEELAVNFARQTSACEIVAVCDVDSRAIDKCVASVQNIQNRAARKEKDLRRMLENRQIDACVLAMPDHWHAPAALLALQAGKHVYLEKPVSYTPREGEMLLEAKAKYGKVIQVGTQRRSWPRVAEAVKLVQEGIIGKVHMGKAWYVNNRAPIGKGNIAAVPNWLDWDIWQGPAPRTAYRDNIIHYNWHWFWHWGTGESLNNGTHMIDLLCWGMNRKYPTQVSAMGGRYYYNDDWETPDTQVINIKFGNDAQMIWEGYTCSSRHISGANVGLYFYGDQGSVHISGGNDFKVYDKRNNVIREGVSDITIDPLNRVSPASQLDILHIVNFFDAIRTGAAVAAPIEAGQVCTLLMQLANISIRTGRTLNTNPANGHIINDNEAQGFWTRSYEPGWEPTV
jgi:predicted dehydrogenase